MRISLLVSCLTCFCAISLAQNSTAQQMVPEQEPSLADAAKKATKPAPAKAKVVVDNDAMEQKRNAASPIPDLGSPDLSVNEVVGKIIKFRDDHSIEEAKRVISGWFADQKARIEQVHQRVKMYDQPVDRRASPDADFHVWQKNSVASQGMYGADNRSRAELSDLESLLRGQYERVREKALQRGIPREWTPKEPGEDD